MVEHVESESIEKQKRVKAGPMEIALLDEIAERLLSLEKIQKKQVPEGIVEPLNPVTVTSSPKVVHPPFRNKLWFSITIVKEEAVAVYLRINTKNESIPYRMSADEKVFDQNFSIACIEDVMLWTDPGVSCQVKVRGSR